MNWLGGVTDSPAFVVVEYRPKSVDGRWITVKWTTASGVLTYHPFNCEVEFMFAVSSFRLAVLAYGDIILFVIEWDNSFCESYLTQGVTNYKKCAILSTNTLQMNILEFIKLYSKDYSLYFRKSHSLMRWIWQLNYKFSLLWNFLSIFYNGYEFEKHHDRSYWLLKWSK